MMMTYKTILDYIKPIPIRISDYEDGMIRIELKQGDNTLIYSITPYIGDEIAIVKGNRVVEIVKDDDEIHKFLDLMENIVREL